jgi:hypothetical protein
MSVSGKNCEKLQKRFRTESMVGKDWECKKKDRYGICRREGTEREWWA